MSIMDRMLGRENGPQPIGYDTDTAFELLKNSRRRQVLRQVVDQDGRVTLSDLAEGIGVIENDLDHARQLTSKERKRVYVVLYQSHLPKLHRAGAIDFDKDHKVVIATERTQGLVDLADQVRELTREVPA